MVPECNGTHFFAPCQQMCTAISKKCNLYSFAAGATPCQRGQDFHMFNCNQYR